MILIRYLAILYFVLGASGCSTSHYSKTIPRIPQAVIEKLDSLFPEDKQPQWTKYRRKYRADFLYKGFNISITFEKDGNVTEGTEEIQYSALPAPISEKIHKNYASFKILMVTMIYKRNSIQYEIEVVRGEFHYILNYNKKGFLMHQYNVMKDDLTQYSTD